MKIKLGLLFLMIASMAQGMNIVSWGMSSRANGKMKSGKFEQEDTFSQATINGGLFGNDGHWFGVFDGHGGPQDDHRTCDQLKNNLHKYFVQASGNEKERFFAAFNQAEKQVINNRGQQANGSMAGAAYVKNGKAHVAHVGDVKVICFNKQNSVSFETKDHIPERTDELDRIKSVYSDEKVFNKNVCMKGDIHRTSRVNKLPTTRVIGNLEAKRASKENEFKGDGAIIATPEYASFDLMNDHHYVFLATDGVWEVMTTEDVAEFINNAMADTVENLRKKYSNKPLVVNIQANQRIRAAIRHIMSMTEKEFEQYDKVAWNKIAQDNKISDEKIRKVLEIDENDFKLIYPPAFSKNYIEDGMPMLLSQDRTPRIIDSIDEQCGNKSEYDEKLMLVARALRDEAVRRGSGDNILVCIADISTCINHGWWQSLSWLKKAGVYGFSVIVLAAIVGTFCCKFVR
jgi:serine/threonine protein phosphatase PrpC